jgi:hypothetical protein
MPWKFNGLRERGGALSAACGRRLERKAEVYRPVAER